MSQAKKKPGPKPGVKPRRVKRSVSVDPDLLARIERRAVDERRSVSEVIDEMLRRAEKTA